MSLIKELETRSTSRCELCLSKEELSVYLVPPKNDVTLDSNILICNNCQNQIDNPDQVQPDHWRCLNDTMWTPTPAVQVVAWRMLNRLSSEGWPVDLLDIMYLEDETLQWAKQVAEENGNDSDVIKHIDSNGVQLQAGDTVILIKDLNVKGGGFTAKRGTAVRNISLVHDDAEHIEGRVNGQQIYIITKFVKKS